MVGLDGAALNATLSVAQATHPSLTPDQRRIVEWGDGPLVVIAGAGTGKTRVIVERVRWLLETKGATDNADPLLPEHFLVLTYNVKAAKELQTRLDQVVGVATRSRMTVSNFHSFCQRILTENAADAGLPPHPDVPRRRRAGPPAQGHPARSSHFVYHGDWWLGGFVQFINRAKDELVDPGRLRCLRRRGAPDVRGAPRQLRGRRRAPRGPGQPRAAAQRARCVRRHPRQRTRARRAARRPTTTPDAADKAADREARRTIAGTGYAEGRGRFASRRPPAHRRAGGHLRRRRRRASRSSA